MTALRLGPGKEFDHIRTIAERLGARTQGLGDDCAVLESPEGDGRIVLSTDLSVEGVHFHRGWLSPQEIGFRATAAALSDLAAAGARVIGVLASLGVPKDDAGYITPVMEGVGNAVDQLGGVVLGGDLTRAPVITLDVTAVGSAQRRMSRGGALPGDTLWVSGQLGGARAALVSWQRGDEPEPAARAAFAAPTPRVAVGKWLAAHGAHAMIDLSDGLASDTRHLAAGSGVSATLMLESVPQAAAVRRVAEAVGETDSGFAAIGGEDYELLVSLPPEFTQTNADECFAACSVRLTAVGHIEKGTGVRLMFHGEPQQLAGFDHFA